jgi:hypothetical protein
MKSRCITRYGVAHFGNGAKTRLRIVTVGIAFFVGISLGLPSANEVVETKQTHVVKRGDTLSKIAQEHLGSHEKYRELAELNGLEIERIDGADFVWLKIGQVVRLSLTEDCALQKSWELIVKRIEKVRRIDLKVAPNYPPGLCITITSKGTAEISGQNIHLTLANLGHIKRVLQWYSLWDFATATRSAAHERAKTTGQIIEYTRVLLALAEQESSYRNVPGRHGEYGWWQMKPSTAVLLDDEVDLLTAERLLQTNPTWTATRVLDHLLWGKKKYGSWEGAFTFYNGGSKNRYLTGSYGKQVMRRMKKL